MAMQGSHALMLAPIDGVIPKHYGRESQVDGWESSRGELDSTIGFGIPA